MQDGNNQTIKKVEAPVKPKVEVNVEDEEDILSSLDIPINFVEE